MTAPSNAELRTARGRFAELLEGHATELDWQRFFTLYPYVFSRSLPLRLVAADVEPLGRPGRSEPDFVLHRSTRGVSSACGVIELKRPDTTILSSRRKHILTLSVVRLRLEPHRQESTRERYDVRSSGTKRSL